ncbi:major facilitator superfamily domain-containing protein [Hypoxylon fragiforme]|uniref:major facilitator superfamily domain-containing protein n=1 Tax=Hypoxylon fragiforme TaxID=63214 RepID=UPI0020C60E76|nr:major facilitator superfamily domain-containing protein [Hypoxylon fragiforme]KAI2604970.1 major facilitator superfamily domain-containing protein [Hypoxylon fragiforme]
MGDITPAKPLMADAALPTEPPVESLEILDAPKVRTKPRMFAILASLYLVLFVAALDQTIVATAIPTISASLHSASGYVWIGGAYLLANAAAGPIWARFSDIWGRKPALLGAVGIFAIASMIAALSINMSMLIAARALQGTAGGGLMQMVAITISDLFSVRNRSLYIGLLGVVWALAGSAGPLIGGALTELVSWQWCFWINLPVCGMAFLCLLLFLDVHNPHTKLIEGVMAVDWFGTISILAVTLLLLLGLDFGGAIFPWSSPKVICLIVFGMVMISFFLFSEIRLAKYPLMPLDTFKTRSNNATYLVAFTHSMVSIGIEYYLPLYFQSVKQASPVRSGTLIVPMMATEAATDVIVGILIHKTARYTEFIWIGAALMTLGTGLYINFGTDTSIGKIIGFEIIGGIGTALLFQTPTIAIQNTVSQADTSSATATLGFIRNVATSLSIVIGGVVFQNSMAGRHPSLAAAGLSESVLEALSGDKAAANVGIVQTIHDAAQRQAVEDAFAWSLRNMFIMYTAIAAVSLVTSSCIKHQDLKTEHTETKTGIEELKQRNT